MQKDFSDWVQKMQEIENRIPRPCKNREVWWCWLGRNIGSEQDGGEDYKRPVLVLRKMSQTTCLVLPLTTSGRSHPMRPPVGYIGGETAFAILSQIRVIDTKRLIAKIQRLDAETFQTIKKAAKDLL